jgi:hypothetical protein
MSHTNLKPGPQLQAEKNVMGKRPPECDDDDDNDGRTFAMVGSFSFKVRGPLPLELNYETAERISELIFHDLQQQGLIAGDSVNIAMSTTLFSADQFEDELRRQSLP